uniref:Uncharacterized protein n=1 Tax=Arundo donax TaxID=35708 RepID=A0A0A9EQV6_ARUDO
MQSVASTVLCIFFLLRGLLLAGLRTLARGLNGWFQTVSEETVGNRFQTILSTLGWFGLG